jgi:hypothetical protein
MSGRLMKSVLVVALFGAPMVLAAQRPSEPAFEVAPIRKNTSSSGRTFMDGAGDRFSVTNASLRMLILRAYELLDDQLVGGPGWINTDRFDIVAVRGGASFDQVAQRFKLLAHSEMREMSSLAQLHRWLMGCSLASLMTCLQLSFDL